MRCLSNFNDFRSWMIEVAFMTSEDELKRSDSVISYEDDILPEIKRLSPASFPCIVFVESGSNHYRSDNIKFLSKSQIEQWAMNMR